MAGECSTRLTSQTSHERSQAACRFAGLMESVHVDHEHLQLFHGALDAVTMVDCNLRVFPALLDRHAPPYNWLRSSLCTGRRPPRAAAGFVLRLSPSSPSESNPTVVIGAAGGSPNVLRVKAWSQVTFVNNDTRPHAIRVRPRGHAYGLPPLNSVGLLLPGESRDTRTLNLPGTCGYHDHNNHTAAAFRGRIIVE